MMIYVWATILVLSNLVWLLLTLLTLPGNWMMVVATVLVGWWKWDEGMFSVWTLGAIIVLAVAGEVLEFASSAVAVRTGGGTRWGAVGSLVGALLGGIFGTVLIPVPIIGSLVGVCGGACLGAWVTEMALGRGVRRSLTPALAGGAGRFVGTVGKFLIGAVIWLIIAVAAYWP